MPRPPAAFSPLMTMKSSASFLFQLGQARDDGAATGFADNVAEEKNP